MAQFPARASPGHPVAHPSPPGSPFPSQPQPQRHERGHPPPAGLRFCWAAARRSTPRGLRGAGRAAILDPDGPRASACAPRRREQPRGAQGAGASGAGGREGGRGREGERLAEEEGSGWDPGCGSLRSPQRRQRPPPPAPPPPASVRKDALSPGL